MSQSHQSNNKSTCSQGKIMQSKKCLRFNLKTWWLTERPQEPQTQQPFRCTTPRMEEHSPVLVDLLAPPTQLWCLRVCWWARPLATTRSTTPALTREWSVEINTSMRAMIIKNKLSKLMLSRKPLKPLLSTRRLAAQPSNSLILSLVPRVIIILMIFL